MRTNEALWEQVKREMIKRHGGLWSARLAQLCVQEYKRRGGEYTDQKRENSLARWTAQDWGYAGEPGRSRYLPKSVREAMTPALKKAENRRKGDRLGERVPYSEDLKRLMRKKGIYQSR